VYGNNSVTLESINELGLLANMLCNTQLNPRDKLGLAPAFGFSDEVGASVSNQDHYINKSTLNGLTFTYAIPIIRILGSGTDKYIYLF